MSKPPVLNFATAQLRDEGIPFFYDDALNMNVVETGNGRKKFIELSDGNAEFQTKTAVERERDDDTIHFATVTRVEREDGDTERAYHLSELMTKTMVQRESDDQRIGRFVEFVTTTKIERETTD